VLCGAVTVPCDVEMGHLERREFTLTKRDRPTGSVRLSLHGEGSCFPVRVRSRTLSGMEFDNMVNWSLNDCDTPHSARSVHSAFCLREAENAAPIAEADPVESSCESEAHGSMDSVASTATCHTLLRPQSLAEGKTPATPASTVQPVLQPDSDQGVRILVGSWKCVATNGLDEFLKATGVGVFQRKIAKAAKWPRWEYNMNGESLVFVNHSAIGDLREDLLIGEEYAWRDGHGNAMTCMADPGDDTLSKQLHSDYMDRVRQTMKAVAQAPEKVHPDFARVQTLLLEGCVDGHGWPGLGLDIGDAGTLAVQSGSLKTVRVVLQGGTDNSSEGISEEWLKWQLQQLTWLSKGKSSSDTTGALDGINVSFISEVILIYEESLSQA